MKIKFKSLEEISDHPSDKLFSYEIFNDLDQLKILEPEWNRLVAEIPHYFPNMTYDWCVQWYETNMDYFEEIMVIGFRDAKHRLIAVVPLYTYKSSILLFKMKIVSLVGGRDPVMTNFICVFEHLPYVITRIKNILYKKNEKWDLAAFRRLNYSKCDTVYLGRFLRTKKIPYNVESRYRVPYVILSGTYSDYYAGLSKHLKKEIKRKQKKLLEIGELNYKVRKGADAISAFEAFLELENQGWKGNAGSSLLKNNRLKSLYEKHLKLHNSEITVIIFELYLQAKLISSSICFKTLDGLYVFKIAYDETYQKSSPGLLLRLKEIEYCFSQNLKIYDFSGVGQKWMTYFTDRGYYVLDIIFYRKTLSALVRFLIYVKYKNFLKKHFILITDFFKNKVRE